MNKQNPRLGMAAHVYNPSTWEAEEDYLKLKASLVQVRGNPPCL